MKKVFLIIIIITMISTTACNRPRYCKCAAVINDEYVELSDDYYMILDHSTCDDKAKEIEGWPNVKCTSVSEEEVTGVPRPWWEFWKN